MNIKTVYWFYCGVGDTAIFATRWFVWEKKPFEEAVV